MRRALAVLVLVGACSGEDVVSPQPGEVYYVSDAHITGSVVTQPGRPGLVPSCPDWRDDCAAGGLVHYEYLTGAYFYAHVAFPPGFDPAVDADPAGAEYVHPQVEWQSLREETEYVYSGESRQTLEVRVEGGRLVGVMRAAVLRGCLYDDIIEDCGAPPIPYDVAFDLHFD